MPRNPVKQMPGGEGKAPEVSVIGQTVRRIWSYMANRRFLFTMVLFMIVLSSALSLLGPYMIGMAIDVLIVNFEQERLWQMLALLALVFIFQATAEFLQNFWMVDIAQRTVLKMRSHLFSHVQLLPLSFFQKRQTGDLMSRLTNDVENISRTLNSSFIQLTTSVLTITGTICIMLWISPLLTVLTLTVVPAMFYGMKWITSRTGRYFKEQQQYLGEMNGFVEETFSGHKTIKLYSRQQHVIDTFNEANGQLKTAGYWAQVYSGFIPKVMNSLNNLSFAVIVGAGGLLAMRGIVSIGEIVTFVAYARQFTRPLNDLANQYNVILSAVAGAERVFAIIDEQEEKDRNQEAEEVKQLDGSVTFADVSFAYQSDEPTLQDIHFHVEPGQTVALVGPTGAGKTTIVSLLARFYEPESGRILIDSKDIEDFSLSSLRNHLGVVLQDAYLFETTVMENIRYGRLDATDEEVMEAAKAANAHSFICKLPSGYQTVLRADGDGISHGQRQLLSIARALLSDPALLILDEATSSIDTVTEMKVNDAMQTLMKDRTSFVIAHRLNTIEHADIILVLEKGRIVEKGSHQELIQQNGYYAELSRMQRLQETAP